MPSSLVGNLPALIREAYYKFDSQRERDVFLTAILGILSGCIPAISGRYYKIRLYPHLYMLIIAPAGSGKSTALFARALGKALHDVRKKRQSATNDTTNASSEATQVSKHKWGLFLAGDTTAPRFLQQLHENGGEGIMFQTEIDTLVAADGHEHGGFTTNFREAFQHEDISYSRKSEDVNIEIDKPKLALVFTGTPEQFLKYISSAENGLFSRNLFYGFNPELPLVDLKPKDEAEGGFEEYFLEKGKEVVDMAAFFEAHPTDFKLTDTQWERFNAFINEIITTAHVTHGTESQSASLRLGIGMFRIAMVVSAVRRWEARDTNSVLYCTDEDFEFAKAMAEVYMKHTLTMLEVLPHSGVAEHRDAVQKAFTDLPDSFTREQAVEVGARHHISPSTMDRTLKLYKSRQWLRTPKTGLYQKNKV